MRKTGGTIMSLEDELKGKDVYVEAQLYGGHGEQNSQLYWGKFEGADSLAGREVVVLKDATYYNLAKVRTVSSLKWEDDESRRIDAKRLVIPWNSILSIAEYEKDNKEDE